jgi:hypothetical protein
LPESATLQYESRLKRRFATTTRARGSYTLDAVLDATLASERYRGTSLKRKCHRIGPCSRPMHRALWWSWCVVVGGVLSARCPCRLCARLVAFNGTLWFYESAINLMWKLIYFQSPFGHPNSGLRRDYRVLSTRKSVTLSVANPLCQYRIAYRLGPMDLFGNRFRAEESGRR